MMMKQRIVYIHTERLMFICWVHFIILHWRHEHTCACVGCTPFLFWMWLKEEEEQWQQFSWWWCLVIIICFFFFFFLGHHERRHRGSSKRGRSFGCQSYLWWMGIVGAAPSNKRKSSQSTTLLYWHYVSLSTACTLLFFFFWCSIIPFLYFTEPFLCSPLLRLARIRYYIEILLF